MNDLAEKYLRQEALPTIFCPGCGDGTLLSCFIRALDRLGLRDGVAAVSGIGCSSWVPVYLDLDVLHCLHGRAIPHAEGLKAACPDKKVVVFTGDGDCVGIGGNHLIHAARRNIDLTVIMMSNYIYGMTGGQKAPTTPFGVRTKTSPLGNEEHPFDVSRLIAGAGGTYFARWTTAHPAQLERAIVDGIGHRGFALIEVLSQCPTQAGKNIFGLRHPAELIQWYRDHTYVPGPGEPPEEKDGKIPLGLLHRLDGREEYTETLEKIREAAR